MHDSAFCCVGCDEICRYMDKSEAEIKNKKSLITVSTASGLGVFIKSEIYYCLVVYNLDNAYFVA